MTPRKLRHVYCEKTRHGRNVYYFRRGKGTRVRLPDDPDSASFSAYYNALLQQHDAYHPDPKFKARDAEREAQEIRTRCERVLRKTLKACRRRASEKGVPFDLDANSIIGMLRAQNYQCALTGIPFFHANELASRVDPFTPSIDRITPALGYVEGNIRVVCYAINAMLLDWGELAFRSICTAYFKRCQSPGTPNLFFQSYRTSEKNIENQ